LAHEARTFEFSRVSNVILTRKSDCDIPRIVVTSHICVSCMVGKHKEKVPRNNFTRLIRKYEFIHFDLWFSSKTSLASSKYFVLFTNDYGQNSWVFF
jgi:hypothetical protein